MASRTSAAERRPPAWRILAGLVLGLLAVLSAVVLPFAPVRMSTPEVTWPQVPASPVSTMLELTSQKPLTIDVTVSCAAVRAAGQTSDGVLLATLRPDSAGAQAAGLVMRVRNGGLRVMSAGRLLVQEAVPEGPCSYTVRGDGSGMRIERDGVVVGRAGPTALPDIDLLATSLTSVSADDGEELRVRVVVDDQFATSPTVLKTGLTVVGLAAGLLALVWLRVDGAGFRPRSSQRRPRWGPAFWVRRGVDALVVGALGLWTLITPMTGDDGYYAAMARNAPREGYVGNYFQLLNQSFTPFTWFYRLLGWWEELVGSAPALLRVPALVAGLATYVLAARLVAAVPHRGPWPRAAAHAVLAVVFLVWWLPYDMGLRPEAMVALAGVGTLLAVTTAQRRASPAWYGIAVLVGSVGFVCHPTGFVALAPLLAGLPALIRIVRVGRWPATLARLLCVVAPGAVAAVVAFGDGTLRDFLRGQEIFLAAQPQTGWTDEYQRYSMLLGPGFMGAYAKRLPVLIAIVALAGWLVLAAVLRGRGRPLPVVLHLSAVSLGLSLLLLWPTPSKWSFHFGSLVGVGAVFLTLLLCGLPRLTRQAHRGRLVPGPAVLAAAGAVVLAVALSFAGTNSWPSSWMLGVPQPDLPPAVLGVPLGSLTGWILLTALVTGALWELRRRRLRNTSGRPSWRAAAVAALPALLVGALVMDGAYLMGTFGYAAMRPQQSWSPWGDTLRDPLAGHCHASGAFQVLSDVDARPLTVLPGQPAPPASTPATFVEGSGWYDADPPASTAGRVWGSLQAPALDTPTGSFTTDWFELPPVDGEEGAVPPTAVVLTAAGNLGAGNDLVAEFGRSGPGGVEVVGRQRLGDGQTTPVWRALVLDAEASGAAGADTVRLVAHDGTTAAGGWLAFSEPAVRSLVSIQSYLGGDEPVAVAWQISLLFPCQEQPRVQYGITEPSDYGVLYGATTEAALADAAWLVDRGGIFAPVVREASLSSLPTMLPGAPQVEDVAVYRFEYPYPAGRYVLTPRTTTVSGWAPPPAWGDRPAR